MTQRARKPRPYMAQANRAQPADTNDSTTVALTRDFVISRIAEEYIREIRALSNRYFDDALVRDFVRDLVNGRIYLEDHDPIARSSQDNLVTTLQVLLGEYSDTQTVEDDIWDILDRYGLIPFHTLVSASPEHVITFAQSAGTTEEALFSCIGIRTNDEHVVRALMAQELFETYLDVKEQQAEQTHAVVKSEDEVTTTPEHTDSPEIEIPPLHAQQNRQEMHREQLGDRARAITEDLALLTYDTALFAYRLYNSTSPEPLEIFDEYMDTLTGQPLDHAPVIAPFEFWEITAHYVGVNEGLDPNTHLFALMGRCVDIINEADLARTAANIIAQSCQPGIGFDDISNHAIQKCVSALASLRDDLVEMHRQTIVSIDKPGELRLNPKGTDTHWKKIAASPYLQAFARMPTQRLRPFTREEVRALSAHFQLPLSVTEIVLNDQFLGIPSNIRPGLVYSCLEKPQRDEPVLEIFPQSTVNQSLMYAIRAAFGTSGKAFVEPGQPLFTAKVEEVGQFVSRLVHGSAVALYNGIEKRRGRDFLSELRELHHWEEIVAGTRSPVHASQQDHRPGPNFTIVQL